MDTQKAQAVANVAKQINDTAKNEISYLKVIQRAGVDITVSTSSLLKEPKREQLKEGSHE